MSCKPGQSNHIDGLLFQCKEILKEQSSKVDFLERNNQFLNKALVEKTNECRTINHLAMIIGSLLSKNDGKNSHDERWGEGIQRIIIDNERMKDELHETRQALEICQRSKMLKEAQAFEVLNNERSQWSQLLGEREERIQTLTLAQKTDSYNPGLRIDVRRANETALNKLTEGGHIR